MADDRVRTYSWQDPQATAAAGEGVDGLTFMKRLLAGEVPPPPIADTLGMTLRDVGPGRAVFEIRPAEYLYNPIGSIHGGVYATVLDSAAGCAVHTMLPAGDRYTSLDLTVKFLRGAGTATGPLFAEGTVLHMGRRTALAEAKLVDEDGKLFGHATSSIMLLRG